MPLVPDQIVDSKGNCPVTARTGKIMLVYLLGLLHHVLPFRLKFPINSFFLVSTLMIGTPAVMNASLETQCSGIARLVLGSSVGLSLLSLVSFE